MAKLELDIEKISKELRCRKKNKSWLASQIGVSSAMITWMFKHKPISYAERIGIVFDIDPKDLIRSNNVS